MYLWIPRTFLSLFSFYFGTSATDGHEYPVEHPSDDDGADKDTQKIIVLFILLTIEIYIINKNWKFRSRIKIRKYQIMQV